MVQELPVSVPLRIVQGVTFRRQFRWSVAATPADLTGYTAHLQIRDYPDAAAARVDLTEGAGITLDATGDITVELTATESAALPAGRYVYDLHLTQPNGGDVIAFLTGTVTVTPAVSQP